ncbi:hypothetical protein NE237_030550 [Protea cynaroides]|uniref:Uncharacterized protein n=1 Tax=Protea cynaroides TaxID=273540 RepID=A0A9Q0JXC2_9MAGN|nr:hypothetical protein NE237_030550 [Protea cynaroides]
MFAILAVVMLDLTQGWLLAEGAVSQSMTTGDVAYQLLQRQGLSGTGVTAGTLDIQGRVSGLGRASGSTVNVDGIEMQLIGQSRDPLSYVGGIFDSAVPQQQDAKGDDRRGFSSAVQRGGDDYVMDVAGRDRRPNKKRRQWTASEKGKNPVHEHPV